MIRELFATVLLVNTRPKTSDSKRRKLAYTPVKSQKPGQSWLMVKEPAVWVIVVLLAICLLIMAGLWYVLLSPLG